jgi:hypothetical protein
MVEMDGSFLRFLHDVFTFFSSIFAREALFSPDLMIIWNLGLKTKELVGDRSSVLSRNQVLQGVSSTRKSRAFPRVLSMAIMNLTLGEPRRGGGAKDAVYRMRGASQRAATA